eukprot:TRINITY_DN2814_c0_g1_i1.p1 TRINITY_DN2814_c0_g1~~TRINITY_DN2814_c0_g1_i1.p1  ORF type:complete len:305 (+),score=56.27 TRINITY_DN2814_c0_g1_i1:75-989(+)
MGNGKPVTAKYSSTLEDECLSAGATAMQGWRKEMEDAHTTILNLDETSRTRCSFFAVFDGHSGQATAQYCGQNIHKKVTASQEYKERDWASCVRASFLTTDADWEKERDEDDTSGSTAVMCLISPSGQIVVGNAGDSRCVLSRGGKAIPLSQDHKPTNKTELARIQAAGDDVINGRVNGNLALSRAIGDFAFKQNKDLPPEEQSITAAPDITVTEMTGDDEFIVLACDGIWDVMTNEEVVDFVGKRIENTEISQICEEICSRCLAPRGTGVGCDNMTIIIILIKDLLKENFGLTPASKIETCAE